MSAVLTVGVFDGVHLGHQAVVNTLVRRARHENLPAMVVTFEPHPRQVLGPGAGPALLTERAEKSALLADLGVDRVHVLRFTPAFARIEAAEFVRDVVVGELGAAILVTGEDHRFGHARTAGLPELRTLAAELELGLEIVPRVLVSGEPVSSTRCRAAVAAGDLDLARSLLGRAYGVFAPAIRGAGRGRHLGVPTVNLAVPSTKQMPPEGIYAARALVEERAFAAAVHWGPRPTYGDANPVLEAHLLGFDGDLYGRWVEISFLERLRDIGRFADAGALVDAMGEDLRRTAEIAAPEVGFTNEGSRINSAV